MKVDARPCLYSLLLCQLFIIQALWALPSPSPTPTGTLEADPRITLAGSFHDLAGNPVVGVRLSAAVGPIDNSNDSTVTPVIYQAISAQSGEFRFTDPVTGVPISFPSNWSIYLSIILPTSGLEYVQSSQGLFAVFDALNDTIVFKADDLSTNSGELNLDFRAVPACAETGPSLCGSCDNVTTHPNGAQTCCDAVNCKVLKVQAQPVSSPTASPTSSQIKKDGGELTQEADKLEQCVLMDFGNHGCPLCDVLDQGLANAGGLAQFGCVKVVRYYYNDIDPTDPRNIFKRYGIKQFPTIVIEEGNGKTTTFVRPKAQQLIDYLTKNCGCKWCAESSTGAPACFDYQSLKDAGFKDGDLEGRSGCSDANSCKKDKHCFCAAKGAPNPAGCFSYKDLVANTDLSVDKILELPICIEHSHCKNFGDKNCRQTPSPTPSSTPKQTGSCMHCALADGSVVGRCDKESGPHPLPDGCEQVRGDCSQDSECKPPSPTPTRTPTQTSTPTPTPVIVATLSPVSNTAPSAVSMLSASPIPTNIGRCVYCDNEYDVPYGYCAIGNETVPSNCRASRVTCLGDYGCIPDQGSSSSSGSIASIISSSSGTRSNTVTLSASATVATTPSVTPTASRRKLCWHSQRTSAYAVQCSATKPSVISGDPDWEQSGNECESSRDCHGPVATPSSTPRSDPSPSPSVRAVLQCHCENNACVPGRPTGNETSCCAGAIDNVITERHHQNCRPQATPRPCPSVRPTPEPDCCNRNMDATVRITQTDATGRGIGTGTIVGNDNGRITIWTAGHVAKETGGTVSVEIFGPAPASNSNPITLSCTVGVSQSLPQTDFAVVTCDTPRNLTPTSACVAEACYQIRPGDRVTTIGCSNGNLPTEEQSTIDSTRWVNPPEVSTIRPGTSGRSGGGLFNSACELIGLSSSTPRDGGGGIYTPIGPINDVLDRVARQNRAQPQAEAMGAEALMSLTTDPSCSYEGVLHAVGSVWQCSDGCNTCYCTNDSQSGAPEVRQTFRACYP